MQLLNKAMQIHSLGGDIMNSGFKAAWRSALVMNLSTPRADLQFSGAVRGRIAMDRTRAVYRYICTL